MKKLLALVLALVMSLSLVTISNAAFKDGDKINADYNEAVDVMVAVGVLKGYDNGNFGAKDTLTREQAAKIIAYLELGEKAADALVGGATFTDVAATRWSAGFVGYCAQAGVVNGVGNGNFDPAGQLTALQFGKMLLVELGYDAKAEKMVGTDWAINTSKLMATAKLMDKIDGSVNQVLTREQAAQMCLNAIEAPMVTYETKGSSISVNGAEINFGASVAKYETSTIAKDQNISRDKLTSGEYTVELGEKLYKDLKKVDSTDDFARPATKWTWKAEKVGTYVDKADLTYTAEVKSGDIYKDLNLSDKIESKDVRVYVNGKTVANNVALVKGGESALGQSANGVLTEVFYDDVADTAKIVQIHTYVGSIAKSVKATDKKDAYVVVTPEAVRPIDSGSGLEFETNEKFEDDAVVYYTFSETVGQKGEIQSVAVCESIEGTVTETQNKIIDGKESKSVTINGTTYKAAKKFAGEQIGSITVKNDYKVYLDKYGYMLKIEEVENLSANYALVLDLRGSNSFDSSRAKLLFGDGTEKVVNTEKDYTKASNKVKQYDIVTYKVDNGVYTLKAVPAAKQHSAAGLGAGEFELINDKAGVKLEKAGITNDTLYTNSKTTFVVKDLNEDEINAYTGVKNAPTVKTTATVKAAVYAYTKSGSMTTIMFVLADNGKIIEDDNNKKLYVASESVSNLINDNDGSYFVYNAVVNGETKTVKVADDCTIDGKFSASSGKTLKGIYKSFTTNSKGIITSVTTGDPLNTGKTNEYMGETGIAKTSEDYTISAGLKNDKTYNHTITVDKDAKIYYVDKDGKIGDSSYNAIAVDDNDTIYAYVDDYMVKMLFIEEVTDKYNDNDYSGSKGAFSYRSNNFKGWAVVNFTLTAPEYAAPSATVTANVIIKANGEPIATVSPGVSFTASNGKYNGSWNGYVFDENATITAEIEDDEVNVTDVAVKYVNGDTGDTLYLDSWNNAKDVANKTFVSNPTGTLSISSGVKLTFQVKTDDTGDKLSYSISGLAAGNVKDEDKVTLTNASASQSVPAANQTAKGNDFVVVKIFGLNKLTEKLDITAHADLAAAKKAAVSYYDGAAFQSATAAKMSTFGEAKGTNDTLKVEFTDGTTAAEASVHNIANGNKVYLLVTAAGTGANIDDFMAYEVSVKIGVKGSTTEDKIYKYTVTADKMTAGEWITVNDDLEVKDVTAVGTVEKLALVPGVETANKYSKANIGTDGMSLSLVFNSALTKEDTGKSVAINPKADAITDFVTVAAGGINITGYSVNGNVLTLEFNRALANGDKFTVTASKLIGAGIVKNVNGAQSIEIKTDAKGYIDADLT